MGNSATGIMEPNDSSCETFTPRGRSRITKVPQQLRNFEYGKLLNKFQNHPRPRPKTVNEPTKSANILKVWKWEIFNCALAIGMLVSMYSILLHYDGRRIPDWGTAINLSTLIALMATILRTMLAFVVSEIIGQAKWDHFAGGARPKDIAPVRRLIETSRFNEASQGMLGAVKLLPTIIRDPATLTAVMVMIVSLGTGSFVQQAIQTQSCQFAVDSAHASLPVTRNISGKSTRFSDVFAAASSALAPDSEDVGSPISVGCLTGNCTFQNPIGGVYSTLGMCSSCVDASSLITSTEPQCRQDMDCKQFITKVTLPNGMSDYDITQSPITLPHETPDYDIKGSHTHWTELLVSPTGDLDWADGLVSQNMKALSQWALENVTILAPNLLPTSSGDSGFIAVPCTLYLCLRSYTSEVRSGKLDEVLVGTTPALPDVVDYPNEDLQKPVFYRKNNGIEMAIRDLKAVKSPCFVNGTVWTKDKQTSTLNLQRVVLAHAVVPEPGGASRLEFEDIIAPAECIYSVDPYALYDLLQTMAGTTFNGSCSVFVLRDDQIGAWYSPDLIECSEKFWLTSFLNENEMTAANIIKRMQAFADRLSNKMRMGFLNEPETVSGQVLQMTVCSRIHYSWLAFPAVLVALTSGLLAWTMFRSTRRQGRVMVWKTSILPFLFYSERFVVQNGEDVSTDPPESLRRDDGAKEPLMDLDHMEREAKQRKVCFDMFN